MKKYEELIDFIIKNVGGKNNILNVTHCVTRLRFQLKDESKANDDALKNNSGIITVMHSAGQYQVVIGNHVGDVYKELVQKLDFKEKQDPVKKENEIQRKSFRFNFWHFYAFIKRLMRVWYDQRIEYNFIICGHLYTRV